MPSSLSYRALHIAAKPFKGWGRIRPLGSLYRTLLNRSTPKEVNVGGVKMVVDKTKGGIPSLLLETNEYEPFETKLFCEAIKGKDGHVVDVGANIGYYTLLAGKLLATEKGTNRVFSFEPDEKNFDVLCDNIARNELTHVVSPLRRAVSDVIGMVTLYTSQTESGEHNIVRSHNLTDGHQVLCHMLDEILLGMKVRVIKIDVEGAEVRVLKGAVRTIARNHPIIFVECWEEGLKAAGTSIDELLSTLTTYGYNDIHMVDEHKRTLEAATAEGVREYNQVHNFSPNLICRYVYV